MDLIAEIAKIISNKFILCENGYAHHEMKRLTQLLLEQHEAALKDPKLNAIIEQIIQAQECNNYIYIADLLEYELVPFFSSAHG